MIYKLKNWKLRYKEKIHGLCLLQIYRLGKMVSKHPLKSFKQSSLKITFGLTYRCQCGCIYCCSGKYTVNKKEELTTKEIIETIRQISFVPSFATAISLSGGEALLRDDIYEFIHFANKRGLFTELESNGILLDLENVNRLKGAGIHHIFVRLESSKPEIHDKLSNYDGCFKKAVKGIENCVRKKIACTISTIAFKDKIYSGDLKNIINLGRQLGVTSIRIIYPTLSGSWFNAESQILNEDEKKYVKNLLESDSIYLESTYSAHSKTDRICSALEKKLFYISPYGEVQPCVFIPIQFGNIRTRPLLSIVNDMGKSEIFKNVRKDDCLMNQIQLRNKYICQDKTL